MAGSRYDDEQLAELVAELARQDSAWESARAALMDIFDVTVPVPADDLADLDDACLVRAPCTPPRYAGAIRG